MQNNALIVVDVQRGFLNEHTAHIPALVESILPRYACTVATKFLNPPGSNFRRLIRWERFSPGSQDTELAFVPKADTLIVEKSVYSCVTPAVLRHLDESGVSGVHIVGIDTDICVSKCAVDLFELDRTPFVLARYCASHAGLQIHAAALQIIARYIGRDQVLSGMQ